MARTKVIDLNELNTASASLAENKVKKLDLLSGKDLRVRAVSSRSGSWPMTVQPEQHVFIVLQGSITFEVAPVRDGQPMAAKAEQHTLKAGQAIIIPPNMAHGGSVKAGRVPAMAAEVMLGAAAVVDPASRG